MLKNYFKIAWRNLTRNRLRTAIHVLGLSLGISICFLIFNVVWHAHSFDKFHPDRDQIFRINTLTEYVGGESYPNSGTPGPLGEVIDSEISSIEVKGRLYTMYQTLVTIPEGNKVMGRTNLATFADPGFFKIFPRKWLAGNPETALEKPNSAVLTQSQLELYFPGVKAIDALGKEVNWIDADTFSAQITGIVEDYTANTDLIFKDFLSFSTIQTEEQKEWMGLHHWGNVNSSSQLFVKMQQTDQKSDLEESLKVIADKNYSKEADATTSFSVEPLEDIHFGQTYNDTSVSKVFLNGLIYIGLIILILAVLNFVNLETAMAIGRSKEVGIRKTLGGRRWELVSQFLSETYLLVIFSTLVALAFAEMIRNLFSAYLPEGFSLDYLQIQNLGFYLLFPLLLTVLSGVYPAISLSSYQPSRAIKGEKRGSTGFSLGVFLRKNLTVIQFSSSIAFIILVLVLQAQLRYVSSQPLGFEKDAVLYSGLPWMSEVDKMDRLQQIIGQESTVSGVSLSGSLVSSTSLWTSDAWIPVDSTEKQIFTQVMNVDSAFIRVNGIPLLAGKVASNREEELVVNENFLKEAGYADAQSALNQRLKFGGSERTIVGVMANFHSRTLREEIKPLVFTYNPKYFQTISVKLEPGQNLASVKMALESKYKEIYPFEAVEFQFLDEVIAKFYEEDARIRNVLSAATVLAILISGMGLFGLSSFTIAQRTKEISIRKVLGASVAQILGLISKEYVLLVGISFLLAIFPAYYFLRDWLNEFTYRVDMPYLLYAVAGLGVMVLCLLIVGLHSYTAAQTNPAKVLKDE
ncbi:ABC transporter permease [Algoriphagus litoralis]|uniref:ABC transporter permease n=1 Tax=Algoriphagus litoralis TaxID=2202829 RepID=UPI000DBA0D4C|nr:ABC transporter permease [Algoriphagus litoralis]